VDCVPVFTIRIFVMRRINYFSLNKKLWSKTNSGGLNVKFDRHEVGVVPFFPKFSNSAEQNLEGKPPITFYRLFEEKYGITFVQGQR